MSTPAWLDAAVFYQIYPQSFCDGNGDGIGDLPGIESKLDYLADLGVNAVWINPCYASPFRDAGYDIVDHCRIDPRYGTLEDMERLIAAAHGRGIRICLDLVPGHTSDQHPWFLASQRPERNEHSDRYVWTDDPWMARDGDLEFLRGNADRMGAYAINFFAHQPALNYGFAEPHQG
jgi:glycosidase